MELLVLASGMFGVGGGFLMTPLLIFFGVPAPVAVSTEANQIVASSVSGVIAHWKKGYVDIKMGVILLVGGLFGSSVGVFLFSFLKQIGQIDFVVKVSYVFFLGIIGILMFYESYKSILNLHKISIKRKNYISIIGFMDYLLKLGFVNLNCTLAHYYH